MSRPQNVGPKTRTNANLRLKPLRPIVVVLTLGRPPHTAFKLVGVIRLCPLLRVGYQGLGVKIFGCSVDCHDHLRLVQVFSVAICVLDPPKGDVVDVVSWRQPLHNDAVNFASGKPAADREANKRTKRFPVIPTSLALFRLEWALFHSLPILPLQLPLVLSLILAFPFFPFLRSECMLSLAARPVGRLGCAVL